MGGLSGVAAQVELMSRVRALRVQCFESESLLKLSFLP